MTRILKAAFTFGLLFPFSGTRAQQQPLTTTEKVYGLSKFWQEASYNFAYFDNVPDLNFDSLYQAYIPQVMAAESDYEYYRLLQRFCATLKDGHTYIMFPKHLAQQVVTPQLSITRLGSEVYITNTATCYQKSIPLGSKILEVDNRPVLQYLNDEVYPYFTASTEHIRLNTGAKGLLKGPAGTNVTLRIQKPNKQVATVTIKRENGNEAWVKPVSPATKSIEFKMLKGGVGLLSINSFSDGTMMDQFKEILPEIRRSKGLIIDVRKNNGGVGAYAYQLVQYLTDKPAFVTLTSSTRRHLADRRATASLSDTTLTAYFGLPPFQVSDEIKPYLAGKVWETEPLDTVKNEVTDARLLMPLVILTSNQTVSAAEDFLIALENVNRGIRVGQSTKGSTGQPLFMKLPGGGFGAICTRRNIYPDGRRFVGVGVVPHVKTELTLDDYLTDKDLTLAKGMEVLKQEMKK